MNRILGLQNSGGRRILAAQNYVDTGAIGDIVNDRDILLQSTFPRSGSATNILLLLVPSENAFQIASNGAVAPASITFTPIMLGITGTVAYGSSSGSSLTFPGGVPTLNYNNMLVESCVITGSVTVDGVTYSSVPITIRKQHDAADAEDITADSILTLLEGRVEKSSLNADLRTLIDGPDSDPTTIPGKIKKETDLRVTFINKEIADRIAALVAEAGARTTYVQSFTFSKQDITSAIAIKADAITAAYTAYADATKTQAKADAAADVRQYAYSKGDIDSAEVAQTNTLTTNYKSYADGVGATATSNSNSFIQTYAYGKSTIDSTLASLSAQLRSEFTDNNGVSVSYLSNYAFSKAETQSAISSATQTLITTVGQHTTAIQQQFTSIDGLSGQLVWKIDNNNHVTGFGLASTPINGVPYSMMIFNVDVLAVALPGGTGKPIFTVGQVNGQPQAVFRSDLFVDGGLTARMIAVGASENAILDANIDDIGWWGFAGLVNPIDYQGISTGWKSRRTLYFPATFGFRDISTQYFPMTPGAIYQAEYSILLSPDFQGNISVVVHLPGQAFFPMGGPTRGYSWPDSQGGLPINFDSNSPKGVALPFNAQFQLGTNQLQSRAQIRICIQVLAGFVEIGGMSITRVVDQTLIGPGVIQTKHLELAYGGHIGLGATGFDLGDGFWLEGPQAGAHGSRMSLGKQGGKRFICDPENEILGLYGADIVLPPFNAYISGTLPTRVASGQVFYPGALNASVTGGSGTVTYAWSIDSIESDSGVMVSFSVTSGFNTPTASFKGSATNMQIIALIRLTATDQNGTVATAFRRYAVIHGTYNV